MEISGGGLVLEGKFPVAFEVIDVIPDSYDLSVVDKKNESFLKATPILEETVDFEDSSVSQELKRQDLKISLLVEMVGELILSQNTNLSDIYLRLTCKGLECEKECTTLKAGQHVKVCLYLAPAFPKPLTLFGQVFIDDAKNKAFVIFQSGSISEQVQEALEKLIFRHHRRMIAQGRRQ